MEKSKHFQTLRLQIGVLARPSLAGFSSVETAISGFRIEEGLWFLLLERAFFLNFKQPAIFFLYVFTQFVGNKEDKE